MNIQNKYQASPSVLLKLAALLLLQMVSLNCYEFNRSTTGVSFSVYIHRSNAGAGSEDWSSYTKEDVKTMTEVISTRFSKILTFGVGAKGDPSNDDIYSNSFSQAFAGEAAALVNLEIQKKNTLPLIQVYIGVWLLQDAPQIYNKEFQLALESAKKANSIVSNTVVGILFNNGNFANDVNALKYVSEKLEDAKRQAKVSVPNVKIGTRQNCDGLDSVGDNNNVEVTELRKKIISETDFIICEIKPDYSLGTTAAVDKFKEQFSRQKLNLNNTNSQILIMGQTEWAARATNSAEVKLMRDYWQLIDKWAADTNTYVWMNEAIDNPWKTSDKSGHLGWWNLKNDAKTGMLDGYVEKATATQDLKPNTPVSPQPSKTNGGGQNVVKFGNVFASFGIFVINYYIFSG